MVTPTEEPDSPELRRRGLPGSRPVLCRPDQQTPGFAQCLRPAVDVERRSVLGGPGRDRAGRALALPDLRPCPRPDFDVAPLPVGPRAAAARSNIGVTGLAIAATSRRREQAWEFVKFACGPLGQALIGESGLFVPVLRSAIHSDGFAAAHRRIANLAVLTEGPSVSAGLPITPAWEKIAALMDRNFGPVLRGSRPATS